MESGCERREGNLVHAGARAAAGLHRRAVRCRSRRNARRDGRSRRQSRSHQSAAGGGTGDRSFGPGRLFRPRRCVFAERRAGVHAQSRTLRVPALGPARLPQLRRGAARHGHRPPGEHRAPGARDFFGELRRRDRRVSRHRLRHRLAHDDGQRSGRRWMGRWRYRSGSGDARPAQLDADSAGARRAPYRCAVAGRHRDRPRTHGHRAAAQAGRRRQDRVSLRNAKAAFQVALPTMQVAPKTAKVADAGGARQGVATATGAVAQSGVAVADPALEELGHGAVVIAAITSCTNTSNPSVMIGAGLLAKKAIERGLTRKPWVKSSLAPGSKVVTEYLQAAGLATYLDQLGFDLVGYGCTTCIGNSGPLPDEVASVVREKSLVVCSVLSGNRNFEGRIQQDVRANYLASPPLVVAYALAGWITKDLTTEPLGEDTAGTPVYLKDIWPTEQELQDTMLSSVTAAMFRNSYAQVFEGDERWRML